MATNADVANGFAFERRVGGGAGVPLEAEWTKSEETLAAGDALILSDGLLTIAENTSLLLHGIAAEAVVGVAAKRQKIAFYPALPDLVFSGQFAGDSTESDLGKHKGICGATGIQEIDSAAMTTSVINVIGLKDGSLWDSHARVLFTIRRSSFTGQSAGA